MGEVERGAQGERGPPGKAGCASGIHQNAAEGRFWPRGGTKELGLGKMPPRGKGKERCRKEDRERRKKGESKREEEGEENGLARSSPTKTRPRGPLLASSGAGLEVPPPRPPTPKTHPVPPVYSPPPTHCTLQDTPRSPPSAAVTPYELWLAVALGPNRGTWTAPGTLLKAPGHVSAGIRAAQASRPSGLGAGRAGGPPLPLQVPLRSCALARRCCSAAASLANSCSNNALRTAEVYLRVVSGVLLISHLSFSTVNVVSAQTLPAPPRLWRSRNSGDLGGRRGQASPPRVAPQP